MIKFIETDLEVIGAVTVVWILVCVAVRVFDVDFKKERK